MLLKIGGDYILSEQLKLLAEQTSFSWGQKRGWWGGFMRLTVIELSRGNGRLGALPRRGRFRSLLSLAAQKLCAHLKISKQDLQAALMHCLLWHSWGPPARNPHSSKSGNKCRPVSSQQHSHILQAGFSILFLSAELMSDCSDCP